MTETALGFEFAADRGAVWLFNAEGNRVLDALHYRPQPDGYSLGRTTDGSAQWDHTKIQVSMRGPSSGSKFVRHHAGD